MKRPRVVVMGVSGCGKSTVGRALALALDVAYVEGDEWHPPRNIALMRAGTPLTDADRHDWLEMLAGRLAAAYAAGQGAVLTCSALKRRYREQLRAGAPDLRLVYLHGARELLAERMADRPDHYMPPSLLQSQLDTLEPPGDDEQPIALDVAQAPAQLVSQALAQLNQEAPA